MATLTVLPTYPVPGRPATLTFNPSESGANYTRVWITDAPVGSEERTKLDGTESPRLPFFAGPADQLVSFVPAVGGVYRFVAQDYEFGASAYGGGYQDDPEGAPSETKIGAEAILTLSVGQRLEQRAGTGSDIATLVIWVFGTTIRPTTLGEHGEVTPALIDPKSSRAALACETAAVRTALAALSGVTVTTALGTPATIVAEMVTDVNAHLANAVAHNEADASNTLPVGLGSSAGPKTLPATVSRILETLRKHFTNDNNGAGVAPAPSGVDTAAFHEVTGTSRNDNLNAPLVSSVSDLESAYVALADIWRAHEAHRVSTAVHVSADATNTLTALPPCLAVHREFFTALAANTPTTPVTLNSGVVSAMALAGFRQS